MEGRHLASVLPMHTVPFSDLPHYLITITPPLPHTPHLLLPPSLPFPHTPHLQLPPPAPLFPSSLPPRYSSPVDLKGLVLDLRGNPGGLLDAAVEIASYLVPSKSDIVSAKSRNGEEVIYRSVIDPIRPPGMKLAVMVSRQFF